MWVSSIVALLRPGFGSDRAARPPAPDLGVDVERHDGAMLLGVAPCLARDAPHDLELVAVRILAVERLGDAVVGRAAKGARLGQDTRGAGQVLDRRHLP